MSVFSNFFMFCFDLGIFMDQQIQITVISVGGAIVIAIVVAICICCCKRK